MALLLCLIPPLLLADKAGILYLLIILIISYSLYLASCERPVMSILNRKVFLAILSGIGITWLLYGFYNSGKDASIFDYSYMLIFRVLGSYTEAMAALVPYVDEYGQLSGVSLPNMKGLLLHDRFNLEASLHYYMTHWKFETDFSGLPGNVLVPAAAEGYANFKWAGFILFSMTMCISVVIAQEFFIRLKMGILSYALMVWYAYLAVTMSMTSIFSTYISLIHTVVMVLLCLLWVVIVFIKKYGKKPLDSGLK